MDGTAPPDASGPLTVLTAEELDNSGSIVPGTVISVSPPVAGARYSPAPPVIPARIPSPGTTSLPKESSGHAAPAAITAFIAAFFVLGAFFRT